MFLLIISVQALVQHLRATFQHNSLRQKAHCQPHLTQAICIIVKPPLAIIEDHFSFIEWSKSQNRLKIELSNCLWNVLYFYTIGNSNFAVGQGHWQCFDFGSVFFCSTERRDQAPFHAPAACFAEIVLMWPGMTLIWPKCDREHWSARLQLPTLVSWHFSTLVGTISEKTNIFWRREIFFAPRQEDTEHYIAPL